MCARVRTYVRNRQTPRAARMVTRVQFKCAAYSRGCTRTSTRMRAHRFNRTYILSHHFHRRVSDCSAYERGGHLRSQAVPWTKSHIHTLFLSLSFSVCMTDMAPKPIKQYKRMRARTLLAEATERGIDTSSAVDKDALVAQLQAADCLLEGKLHELESDVLAPTSYKEMRAGVCLRSLFLSLVSLCLSMSLFLSLVSFSRSLFSLFCTPFVCFALFFPCIRSLLLFSHLILSFVSCFAVFSLLSFSLFFLLYVVSLFLFPFLSFFLSLSVCAYTGALLALASKRNIDVDKYYDRRSLLEQLCALDAQIEAKMEQMDVPVCI